MVLHKYIGNKYQENLLNSNIVITANMYHYIFSLETEEKKDFSSLRLR